LAARGVQGTHDEVGLPAETGEWMRALMRDAFAWENRSTATAVLMLVIRGLAAMRPGSLVSSVRKIRTRGLRSRCA
jgi:hypothetical protein